MLLPTTTAGTIKTLPHRTMVTTDDLAEISLMIGWCQARWPNDLGKTWDYIIALDTQIGWPGSVDVVSGLIAGFSTPEDRAEFCFTWR
jgi:hypothetical protein